MKSAFIERRFQMNRQTQIIVRSKKDKDADIYRNTVTLVHESADIKPLELSTRSDMQDYISGVDLEDEQVQLFGEGKNE